MFLGEDVVIPCPIGGDPEPTIVWVLRGGRMPTKANIIDGSLKIPNVQLNDRGTYRCRGENSVGSTQMDVKLKVRQPPRFSIAPQNLTIQAGQEATFNCQMRGEPEPTVYWKFSEKILPNDDHYDISSNGQLSIQNAQPSDTGDYTCIGTNTAREYNDVTVRLTVIKYDLREPPIIRTVVQNEITLECQIQNANQDDTIWTINTTVIRTNTNLTPIGVSKRALIIGLSFNSFRKIILFYTRYTIYYI